MVIMLVGTFVALLNQTLLNTALPKIMSDLQVSANTAQWLTTVYMLMVGVMVPITAFLTERFTTRKLFTSAMALFATGTLIAAISPSFGMLLVGRLVQASGAGILLPLVTTTIITIFPVEKRGAAMGLMGLAIAFAPAIGPTLSGWLVDNYSWRILFYGIFPIAILVIVGAIMFLKNVNEVSYPKIDILSIVLSSIGFGSILYGFSSAGANGWGDAVIISSLIIGGVSLGLFIWRQLTLKRPMLDFRIFKFGTYALSITIIIVVYMSMISAELLLPLYMQNLHGYTALESGLILLPGAAIIMGVTSLISGRIYDKFGIRWLLSIGLAILLISTFGFTNLTLSTSTTYLIVVYAIRMFGISWLVMPLSTHAMNQLPKRLIPHGTAMTNTLRQVGAAIGTALLVTLVTNTSEHATAVSSEQAMIHGYNTAFMFSVGIAGIAFVLSFFIKKKKEDETKTEIDSA